MSQSGRSLGCSLNLQRARATEVLPAVCPLQLLPTSSPHWTQQESRNAGAESELEQAGQRGVCAREGHGRTRYRTGTSCSGCIRPKPYLLRSNSGISTSALTSSRSQCVSTRTTNCLMLLVA